MFLDNFHNFSERFNSNRPPKKIPRAADFGGQHAPRLKSERSGQGGLLNFCVLNSGGRNPQTENVPYSETSETNERIKRTNIKRTKDVDCLG